MKLSSAGLLLMVGFVELGLILEVKGINKQDA